MSTAVPVVIGQIDTARVKGVLFDVDGTLSDSDDRMIERLAYYFHPFAWLFKNQDIRPFARTLVMAAETPGNFLYRLADCLGLDAIFARILSWIFQHNRTRRSDVERFLLIAGVREMLVGLAKRYPMAVVSARDADSTAQFLQHFEIDEYFEVIITAQSCQHTKPYPEPVLSAAAQLGLAPQACLMIGDTVVDILAGKAAGAQTIAVLCGFGTLRELKKAKADLILSATPQILDILECENNHCDNPDVYIK
jgi:phosphoglycolate phosphatase